MRQRYEMAPYIYTMARKGYDEGLALCRPMYYDYPQAQEAYDFRSQYMFGDDMMIAPITRPSENGFTAMEIWFPEGDWYELHTGTLIQGGKVMTRHFALDEYGVYVKAGSILPFYGKDIKNLNSNEEDIIVTVYPGCEGQFSMYEDAGNSKDYDSSYAMTKLSNTFNGNTQNITISPREGSYEGMPQQRNFKVKVVASVAPAHVTVNGQPCTYSYDGSDFSFTIDVPVTDCSESKEIVITYPEGDTSLACGVKGLSRRAARSIEALKFRTGANPYDALAKLGTINEAVEYNPEKAAELVTEFMEAFGRLDEVLKNQPRINEADAEWFLQHCGWRF